MEINSRSGASASKRPSRRKFAKKLTWTAPALTLMMTASSQRARANFTYGHTYKGGYKFSHSYEGGPKKQNKGLYDYLKVWKRVHRSR